MSIGQTLRDLLAPLGVYRWEGSFQWGELQSEGAALDQAEEALARIQREMHLATAREEGLTGLCHLLGCLAEGEPDQLRQTLAALLRVGSGSFTLAAVNDAVRGCGISALVEDPAADLAENKSILGRLFDSYDVVTGVFPPVALEALMSARAEMAADPSLGNVEDTGILTPVSRQCASERSDGKVISFEHVRFARI